jgi:hypothetical protein
MLAQHEAMTRASQELKGKRAYGKEDDFLAELRLPGVQDSGMNVGLGGASRAQRVLDKARAE